MNLVSIFAAQIILYAIFPFYFATLKHSFRLVFFYAYISIILVVSGFLSTLYSFPLTDTINISGGSLAYGAVMMNTVLLVILERDLNVVRNVIRIIIMVSVFKFLLFSMISWMLSSSVVPNPFNTSPAIFNVSLWIVILGSALTISELLLLVFLFEKLKTSIKNTDLLWIFYTLFFIGVLCLDGVLFPLIASPFTPTLASIIKDGVAGKFVLALAYSLPIALFLFMFRKSIEQYKTTHLRLQELLLQPKETLIQELERQYQAFEDSEENYRSLAESIGDIFFSMDAEMRYTYWNKASETTGYSREEALGKTLYDLFPQTKGTALDEFYKQVLATQKADHFINQIQLGDQNRYYELSAYPFRGGISVLAHDITERQQAELARIKNETRLNQVVQLARLGIWDWDMSTDRVEWRGEMFRIYGISPEEFTGKGEDYVKFTRADYLQAQQENIKKAFENGVTEAQLLAGQGIAPDPKELCIVRPDGSEYYTLGDAICIVDENGKPLHMLGITQDINERKQAERTQARLTAILEATPDYVGITDPNGHIAYINRAGRIMVGLGEDENISGLKIADLSPAWANEIISKEGIPAAIREGAWAGETARLARDGREIPVTQVILAHKSPDGTLEYLSTICRDITERKQAEEKIQRQLDHLTALSEIDRAITSSFDLHQSLETLLSHVRTQLNVDAADVLLFDADAKILRYVAGNGFRTAATRELSIRIEEGEAGRSILEGRIINIPNLNERPNNLFRTTQLGDEAFLSYSSVPLIAKGEVKGVLEVFHRSAFQPDQEWLDFFGALAEQAAIAIDNATLFNSLQRSNQELSLAYDATIEGWSRALDLRDKETEGHTQRVTDMTVKLARTFGLGEAELVHVRWGALLHDIGKMGVPDNILLKTGVLTDEEWVSMKKHPSFAYEMLAPIGYLHAALDIPYCHHEKWDGSGYPRGLKGEQIPLTARIFAVVDVWDALMSDRPYRGAWPVKKVIEHLRSLAGAYFDPAVVKVCLESGLLVRPKLK